MLPALADDERRVTVVLCDDEGRVMGRLDAVDVRPQWWPDVAPVVAAVRERDELTVLVLRLLTTSEDHSGGEVSYLARLVGGRPTGLRPLPEDLERAVQSDPVNRLWWAEPDGLDHLPAWVDGALRAHERRRTGPLGQRKTWNLSVVVTAPTDEGEAWFKATPPFLADEGGVIRRVARVDPELVPVLLAHDPGRRAILMDHIPGEDQFDLADEAVVEAMVRRWVGVQAVLVDDVEHGLAVGARDHRSAALLADAQDLLGRAEVRTALTDSDRAAVETLVAELPRRLDDIAACGLPDTLLHGDMHPGNWRRDGDRLTLLDWGDVGVGNPIFDQRAFVERLADPGLRDRTSRLWATLWQDLVPGSDPARAAYLLGPVAQLAAAAAYQHFLDHIETTERVYHALDPADRLRAAIAAAEVEDRADG
ncbi:MAG: aminoglycoside phosphotransferase family protein [Lapillicoccus sp.]